MAEHAARVAIEHPDREPTEDELDAIADAMVDALLGENPHANNHAGCSPDDCFTAKVRYWKQYPPGVHIH